MKDSIPHQKPIIDFDLRQLEIFCKVVELSSFSKAAKVVFLSQASVSERIAKLEEMVGTRLLDRLGRQVNPTKAGELLYRHAVLLLEMKQEACLEMQDFLGVRQGEIRIGGSTIPGEYILPKVIGRFRKKWPLVSVTLSIADTREIESLVLEGKVEVGVVGSMGSQANLVYHDLWKDELVVAVPPKHPWAEKETVSLQELCEEPFLLRDVGSGTLEIITEYFRASKLKSIDTLSVAARMGTSTAVKEGVKAGLGVSILSLRALDTELKAGLVKVLRIEGLTMPRKFYLIQDKTRTASPLCGAMLDFLLATSERW